ncbi:MAG TPA: hypothetical protein VD902_02835, partial [Symbiobacteriaceae bacterium]|nr:hypothetical protein [Symbiobacteriaceae bacterium]
MGKIMAREAVLLLFCGLFAGVAVPLLLGRPPGAAPFAIGLFYGLSFIAAYAIMLMLGQRLPAAARGGLAALAWLAVVWGSPGGTAWYLQAAPGFSGLAVAA